MIAVPQVAVALWHLHCGEGTQLLSKMESSPKPHSKAMEFVMGQRDLVVKIIGKTGDASVTVAAQSACRTWRDFASSDEVWKELTCARFPRAKLSITDGLNWGSESLTWKERYFKLVHLLPPIVWVDDRPESLKHLMKRIEGEKKCSLFHMNSTREAQSWFSSNIAALSPSLKVITDNHRNEVDEAGEMQSNYEAGSQLIAWLNDPSRGDFADCQILMFCGAGSIPYVQSLKQQYSNVEITISEGTVLKWARQAFHELSAGLG